MTFCPQIQQEKSLKWSLNLNLDMDLTLHGFDEFGWNDPKHTLGWITEI